MRHDLLKNTDNTIPAGRLGEQLATARPRFNRPTRVAAHSRRGRGRLEEDVMQEGRAGGGRSGSLDRPRQKIIMSYDMKKQSVLRTPTLSTLLDCAEAMARGWTPDTLRGRGAAIARMTRISADPEKYLAEMTGNPPGDGVIELPDGSVVPRLPGWTRWIWSNSFAGQIAFRWRPGTTDLPPTCLGHIGYAVVPWRRGEGLATRALFETLQDVRKLDLPRVEITCETNNDASRRVIEKCGGVLIEQFTAPAALGGKKLLRFQIPLT